MKVTMTNGQIVAALNIISKIKDSDRVFPKIKLSYAFNKNAQTLMGYYKPYIEALEKRGLANLTQEELKALPEEDVLAFSELYSCENEVDMYSVTFDDLEGAVLSINEVELIQSFMMED